MDFDGERYVRLYVRDTPTWCLWRWEARALLPCLLRALDKSGRLDWPEGTDAAIAVAAAVKLPVKVVAVGVAEMVRSSTLVLASDYLEMPNYVVAQNIPNVAKSGAERMREHRERRRTRVSDDVVTKCDAHRDESDSQPSPAQPSPTQPTGQRAGARGGTRAASSKPRRKAEPKPLDLRVVPVLAAIDAERAKHNLGPLPPSERHERPILTRLEDGVPLDDLVLAVQLHSAAPDGAGRLNATTPFTAPSGRGPGGWSWSRRLLDEHRARKPGRPPVIADHDVPPWAKEPRS